MNTEGRLTRSRARTTGTPLVKPFGTEIKPRSSLFGKDIGTPLPRAALFDRTNEPSEDKKEDAEEPVTVHSTADTVGDTNSEGTVVINSGNVEAKVTEVPFEDNIVKQLLEEYATLEENLEAEMHITPMRSQSASACKEPAAAETDDALSQLIMEAGSVKKIQQSIHEEMLITPQRSETPPAGEAPSDVTADSAPMPAAEPKIATPCVPVPDAEAEIVAAPATEATMIKEGDGDKAMLTHEKADRWEMDGSPYISGNVQKATAPEAKASKRTVKSEIKPTTPFDPRSLRQIKQELKAKSSKPKVLAGLTCDSEASDTTGAVCAAKAEEAEEASSALCKALDDLLIAPKVAADNPLRGIPVAAGRHTRFTEEGEAVESPSADRTLLRGFPAPAGSHLRFED